MKHAEFKVSIKHENLNELKELLQKAADQVEQLKETLKKIEEFDPITKVI